MKKYLLIFILIIFIQTIISPMLFANIDEDIHFIISLYQDSYYDYALREINKIESQIANNKNYDLIMMIKADLLTKNGDIDEALNILLSLYQKPLKPDLTAKIMYNLAEIYYKQNNFQNAIDLLQLYINQYPNNKDLISIQILLADIYNANKQYNEAISIYNDLLNDSTNNYLSKLEIQKIAGIYKNLSMAYLKNNNINKAETTYNKMLSFSESNPQLWAVYSQEILLQLLEIFEQDKNYHKIIELCPNNFSFNTQYSDPCLFIKISATIKLKNFEIAEQLLSNITNDPLTSNYYRAIILKEKQEYNLALPMFELLSSPDTYQNLDIPIPNSESIRTMSFFNLVQIIAETNPDSAKVLLNDFLIKNPNQDWEGDLFYQLAYLEYQSKKYDRAYNNILRALSLNLNPPNKFNALYLKAEIEFLLEKYEESQSSFLNNIDYFSQSLKEESYFKIGLSYYFQSKPESAKIFLNKLLTEFPHSQKIGVTYYYLGEIELHTNTNQAKSYFLQALKGNIDNNTIFLKIAYINYLNEEYNNALDELRKVPDKQEYLYNKHLLMANIYFALKQYNTALESYRIAEQNAKDQVSVEYIWAKQALTYYNLKYYDRATTIYQRLAKLSNTSDTSLNADKFILSAANTSFNAENYEQALKLYQEYINSSTDSLNMSNAYMGLANSHFNLYQYDEAIKIWKAMINQDQSNTIILSSLKGLELCYQKLNNIPLFTEFINLSILNATNPNFITMLYEYKANFEYEQKNHTASISTINQLLKNYPNKNKDIDLMILLANNHTWLKEYEEADSIYVNLAISNSDPYIYYEWGHIKWAQNDITAAMKRYKRAVDNSNNPEYWINYLEKLLQTKDEEFIKYYNSFILTANDYHKTLAEVYLIEWNIYKKEYRNALELVSSIVNSEHTQFRAKATLLQGEIFLLMNNYDESLTSFLKIRYVFNEFSDIRWKAEYFICKIYYYQNEKNKALQLFENIKSNLSIEDIQDLENLLGSN
ncbi:MAG: tetratricopeptide repeat protein [Candidatus Cloacimonetes bacterium]|nr:tetratricopeptide repeat protein [Candidatus Cloacimonadota bacterium]